MIRVRAAGLRDRPLPLVSRRRGDRINPVFDSGCFAVPAHGSYWDSASILECPSVTLGGKADIQAGRLEKSEVA